MEQSDAVIYCMCSSMRAMILCSVWTWWGGWLNTRCRWDRWSKEATASRLISHGAPVTGDLIGSCQVLPLLSIMWLCVWPLFNHAEGPVQVQQCDVQNESPALTSQRPDSGILPLICCHGAALWGRERQKSKVFNYVKYSRQPATLAAAGNCVN